MSDENEKAEPEQVEPSIHERLAKIEAELAAALARIEELLKAGGQKIEG